MRAALAVGGVHGFAHITGGGIVENAPRILADGQIMRIDEKRWPAPPIFARIASAGVEHAEMRRTFNMGLGMLVVVEPSGADAVEQALAGAGERVFRVGEIVAGDGPARVEYA
jgi:phosphoribosylformylglycinamidine cyclo-ligase